MAVLGRLVRTALAWRAVASLKNVTHPRPRSPVLPGRFYHLAKYVGSAEHQSHSNATEVLPHRSAPDAWRPYSIFPAILAGLFGVGVLDMAYSDGDEVPAKPPLPSESSPGHVDLEEIAKRERQRIEELLRSKGMQHGYYPRFTVAVKGQQEIEFMKQGSLSPKELDAFVSVLELAGGKLKQNKTLERKPREGNAVVPSAEKSVASLESMGVRIYGLNEARGYSSNCEISWDAIAGYDQQKREIEDTILLALHSPEVYDDIARGTRRKFESNRPRAVLFEGPPGTGKTSCARVIANQAGVPLLYVPLEVVMSKYYGESERLLGKVFSLANELPNGAIIFLDEIDSFAVARDNEMHEATRRILSVLLRQIDGFEQDKKVVVIAATNRKQDLDPALIRK
ncbi:hypothetical protein I3760_10G073900 [Carya illinoinensis]|nr:hypothetical protein I3760_10G073900 [Carya illinoinensis]